MPEPYRRRWVELRVELLTELGRLDRVLPNSNAVKFVIRLLLSPDSNVTLAAQSGQR